MRERDRDREREREEREGEREGERERDREIRLVRYVVSGKKKVSIKICLVRHLMVNL